MTFDKQRPSRKDIKSWGTVASDSKFWLVGLSILAALAAIVAIF